MHFTMLCMYVCMGNGDTLHDHYYIIVCMCFVISPLGKLYDLNPCPRYRGFVNSEVACLMHYSAALGHSRFPYYSDLPVHCW